MGSQRRRRAAFVAAPVAASAAAVALTTTAAGAAPVQRSEAFTFTSDATGQSVTCTIQGSFDSTQRTAGDWALTAFVRISEASSPECFDGIAHMTVPLDSGDEQYSGGGSFVQVETTTATAVESISYDVYFNPCACYSPLYQNPK